MRSHDCCRSASSREQMTSTKQLDWCERKRVVSTKPPKIRNTKQYCLLLVSYVDGDGSLRTSKWKKKKNPPKKGNPLPLSRSSLSLFPSPLLPHRTPLAHPCVVNSSCVRDTDRSNPSVLQCPVSLTSIYVLVSLTVRDVVLAIINYNYTV